MNIFFLNPAFLFALPLSVIPIIIHLLTRKKYKNYSFSETKFIQMALRKTVRRHKLREYLLLFLRCLIIFILTLLFSRPVVHYGQLFAKSQEIGKCILFLLDNSYSLSYLEDEKPRFELVKEVAKNLLSELDEFDEIAIGSFSDRLEIQTKNFIQEKKICLEAIEKISLSPYPSDLSAVLRDIYLFLRNAAKKEKMIILISDLAKNGWWNINEEYFKKIDFYDPRVKIVLVEVSKEKGKNYAVEEISLSELSPSKPAIVETQIANYGEKGSKELPVWLYIRQKEGDKKVAAGFLEIAENEKKSKQFIYDFPEESETFVSGYVELDKDNLSLDDRRFFVYPRPERVKILTLDGSPGLSPVESELYYFRLSLNPYWEKGLVQVDAFQNGDWVRKINPSYSLIVLANWKEITEEENERLKSYLKDGGNIFLSLGDKVDLQFYNRTLDWLIPAELVKVKSEKVKITRFTTDHPALKIFSQDTDFSTIVFSTYFVVEPKSDSQVLLEFSDGSPLLLESKPYPEGGKVFLYTSTLNRKWTNFPAKPLYPVLFQELVRYVTRKEDRIFSFNSGEIIRIPFTVKPEKLEIKNLQENLEDREVVWKEEKEFKGYEIKDSLEPGIYTFFYQVKGKKGDGFILVKFDSASGESNPEPITYSEIKNFFPSTSVTYISVKEKYREKFIQLLKGKEITQNLVFITFLLLFFEGFVANRFFVRKK